MASVPIIDISGLSGDRRSREAVARQIGDACERIGFLCITGHGVPDELIRDVRSASFAFFDRPEEEKRLIERKPPAYRGYVPLASEGLARSLGDRNAAVDLKEAFSMGPVDIPDDPYHRSGEGTLHFAPNRWPEKPAELRPALEGYYRVVSDLAGRLLGGFALALDLPEDWFADKIDRHTSTIRALHYPEQPDGAGAGQLRAGAHTDYGCLTILLTDTAPGGLEVLTHDKSWDPVPHIPGGFVVNIGDLMAQWTNDRFVSTMHRVVNPPAGAGTRRLSIGFFHQPNHDALIQCIPTCLREGEAPRYAPITSGEHRLMKVKRAAATMS